MIICLWNQSVLLLFAYITHTFDQFLAWDGFIWCFDPICNLLPFNCPVIFIVVTRLIKCCAAGEYLKCGDEVLIRYLVELFFSVRDVPYFARLFVTGLEGPRVELQYDEHGEEYWNKEGACSPKYCTESSAPFIIKLDRLTQLVLVHHETFDLLHFY